LAWGNGELIVPPESQASVEGRRVTLTGGWLWGQGSSAQPWTVDTPSAEVTVSQGRFAIEQTPGQSGWLYVMDGDASVSRGSPQTIVTVSANQMIALGAPSLAAVPLDPNVFAAFHPVAPPQIEPIWEASLSARLSAGLAQTGIGTAQGVTLLTYSAGILSVVLVPLAGLVWWWKRRGRAN
jgi:hypothetical protein